MTLALTIIRRKQGYYVVTPNLERFGPYNTMGIAVCAKQAIETNGLEWARKEQR